MLQPSWLMPSPGSRGRYQAISISEQFMKTQATQVQVDFQNAYRKSLATKLQEAGYNVTAGVPMSVSVPEYFPMLQTPIGASESFIAPGNIQLLLQSPQLHTHQAIGAA
jgi:hypothetical protein